MFVIKEKSTIHSCKREQSVEDEIQNYIKTSLTNPEQWTKHLHQFIQQLNTKHYYIPEDQLKIFEDYIEKASQLYNPEDIKRLSLSQEAKELFDQLADGNKPYTTKLINKGIDLFN